MLLAALVGGISGSGGVQLPRGGHLVASSSSHVVVVASFSLRPPIEPTFSFREGGSCSDEVFGASCLLRLVALRPESNHKIVRKPTTLLTFPSE